MLAIGVNSDGGGAAWREARRLPALPAPPAQLCAMRAMTSEAILAMSRRYSARDAGENCG
jgi:hypothetical protein